MLYTAAESNVALGPFDMAIYVRKPQSPSFRPNSQNAAWGLWSFLQPAH